MMNETVLKAKIAQAQAEIDKLENSVKAALPTYQAATAKVQQLTKQLAEATESCEIAETKVTTCTADKKAWQQRIAVLNEAIRTPDSPVRQPKE